MDTKKKAEIDAYVTRVVAEAPPLTDEQRDRIAVLLRPAADGHDPRRALHIERALEAERKAWEAKAKSEASLKEARRFAASLLLCDVCSIPPEGHYKKGHEWVPGRAERVLREKGASL